MAPKLKNFITAVEMQRKVQADVKKASSIKQPQGTKEEKPPKTPPKTAETFFTTQDLRDPFDRLGEGRVGRSIDTSLDDTSVDNSVLYNDEGQKNTLLEESEGEYPQIDTYDQVELGADLESFE